MDYAGKNTFLLYDDDGDATYITGKGKSALTVHETIYPTPVPDEGWYHWDVHAGAADDVIDARGSTLDAFLYGDTGNDTIYGGAGYLNHIEGGDGNDLIYAYQPVSLFDWGRTELLGGAGSDTIFGGTGEDLIDGGAGRDIINAGDGDDRVVYDATDISVEADGGRDTIDASSAAATHVRSGKGVTIDLSSTRDAFSNFESIIGSKFNDTLTGDNAENWIDGGAGNDTIKAGGGNDFVVYDASDTSVDGGFDMDLLTAWNSPVGVTIDLTSATHVNFEDIDGSHFNDVLTGDSQANYIYAGDGDDVVDGGGGEDTIYLGYGNDTWVYDPAAWVSEDNWDTPYRAGIDTIDASGATAPVAIALFEWPYTGFDNIIGGSGNDELTGTANWDNVLEGGAGADTIDGGGSSGFGDTASYAGSPEAVTVDLGTGINTGGDAEGDQLSNIRNLLGSQGDDTLTGDTGANWLEGGAGADQLYGGGAGAGEVDFASYARSAAGVMVSLANPSSYNTGDALGDSYTNIAGLEGSAFNDFLIGDAQNNVIFDGGVSYNDYGPYRLFANGDDWIDGGAGDDEISTSSGNDTVLYDAADTVVTDSGSGDGYGNFVDTFDTVDATFSSAGVTIDLNLNYLNFEKIIGSASADVLTGDGDDNVFVGGAGADSLDGWGAFRFGDTASYADSAGAVTVDLGFGTGSGGDAEGDTLANITNLIGSANADTLTGDANYNVLQGGAGADTLNGGDGFDTASYVDSGAAVTVDLGLGTASGGDAAGDTFSSIEALIGSAFNDTLIGDSNDNRIEGAGGADVMDGGLGLDAFVYKSLSESVEGQMDTISNFVWGSGGDFIDAGQALQAEYDIDVGYYTTAFADFAAIKAEAAVRLEYQYDIFAATDGTDTYVFMATHDYDSGGPIFESYAAGSDTVIKLVGVNDLSALSAENFSVWGSLYVDNLT